MAAERVWKRQNRDNIGRNWKGWIKEGMEKGQRSEIKTRKEQGWDIENARVVWSNWERGTRGEEHREGNIWAQKRWKHWKVKQDRKPERRKKKRENQWEHSQGGGIEKGKQERKHESRKKRRGKRRSMKERESKEAWMGIGPWEKRKLRWGLQGRNRRSCIMEEGKREGREGTSRSRDVVYWEGR